MLELSTYDPDVDDASVQVPMMRLLSYNKPEWQLA